VGEMKRLVEIDAVTEVWVGATFAVRSAVN
jgi:hypothetical protein